jgi:hypothetical protein
MKAPHELSRNRYLEAASSLRSSLAWNRHDTEFSRSNNHEIVYIFDTNVYVFFADIRDRKSITRDLDKLLGRKTDPTVQLAMERLTADYLFSGFLPGQRGDPAYVSIPHFGEIVVRLESLRRRLDRAIPGRTTAHRLRNRSQVRIRIEQILNGKGTIQEKWERVSRAAPKSWLQTLDAHEHFSQSIERTFLGDHPSILPLDDFANGREASQFPDSERQYWINLLNKPNTPQLRPNTEDDADTLAAITNLYRNDLHSLYDDRSRLYIFITYDRSVIKAVNRAMPLLEAEGIPNFIRTPADYLPIFNLRAMREGENASHLDDKLRSKLTEIYETLSEALDWIDLAKKDSKRGSSGLNILEGRLEALQNDWAAISEYAAVLNAEYLERGTAGAFEALARFVNGTENANTGTRLTADVALEVRNRHLALVLNDAAGALSAGRRGAAKRRDRRVHLKIIGNMFGNLLDGKPDINSFLDALVRDTALPTSTMEALRKAPERPEAQMLAASLFLAAERWEPAADLAARAVEASKAQAALNEAAYIQALSLRFCIRSEEKFRVANKLLRGNLYAYYRRRKRLSDTLRRLRDEIELGTLLLSGVTTQSIVNWKTRTFPRHTESDVFIIPDEHLHSYFQSGVELLSNAYDEIVNSEPFEFAADRGDSLHQHGHEIVKSLKFQSLSNLCGAYVFERLLPGPQGDNPVIYYEKTQYWRNEIRLLLPKKAHSSVNPRPSFDIYDRMISSLTSETQEERAAAGHAALIAIEEARIQSARSPLCDQLEYEFLEHVTIQRLKASESTAPDNSARF